MDPITYPILDEKNAFSASDFQVFCDTCPVENWQKSVVFSRTEKKDSWNPDVRSSYTCKETNREHIQMYKKVVMKKLLRWLRQQEHFQYCFFRTHHVEWLSYEEKMYFKRHSDFERYKCNGMVPYVALIGLVDTISGGETQIQDRNLTGGCSKNGIAFFPSHIPHESKTIVKGSKICLKMEFFVFFGHDFVQVSDKEKQWKSFWTTEELTLVDNYISAHVNFVLEKKIETSTELARAIYIMMMNITDPRHSRYLDADVQDMLFPNYDYKCLHDLFIAYRFLKEKRRKPVLLKDAKAWEHINTLIVLPTNVSLCCGLWYKENEGGYRFHTITDRVGQRIEKYGQSNVTHEYCAFDTIRVKMIKQLIQQFDMETSTPSTKQLEKMKAKHAMETPSYFSLDDEYPSDNVQTPVIKSGEITETVREFCNDAESGYDTYTYSRYTTFSIQVRWCLVYTDKAI